MFNLKAVEIDTHQRARKRNCRCCAVLSVALEDSDADGYSSGEVR
jgi:hypothetical protein